jgi:hypothetical protein
MTGPAFSLANLREVADALYGKRQWQGLLAHDLNIPPRSIKAWFAGRPLPDIRKLLADLRRRNGPDDFNMQKLARKIERLGPPER